MIDFIVVTILVYLFYYIFMINKYDNDGKLKKKKEHKLWIKIKEKFYLFLFNTTSEKDEMLNRGRKPKKMKEKEDFKIPTEVEILIKKYKIDLNKINYKKLLKMVGLMCSIDIGFIIGVLSILPTDNLYIKLGVGALLVIPVILIGYSILGNYLKKKGLVKKNGNKHKRNRK